MAKKFSIVRLEEKEIFMMGFVEPIDLSESDPFIEIMMDVSPAVKVDIEIEHCLLLDFPGNDTDISIEELEILIEDFDTLLENDNIFCEESITFEMAGLSEEDEYVEY